MALLKCPPNPPCPRCSQVPVPPKTKAESVWDTLPFKCISSRRRQITTHKVQYIRFKLVSWQAEILRVNFRAKQLEHTGRSGQVPANRRKPPPQLCRSTSQTHTNCIQHVISDSFHNSTEIIATILHMRK